jgi:DNA polymerase-1
MTVTATGRLSSTEPNLQNIPTRTDLGSEIRRMFVPAEGCVLVDADYSQIELRILAHAADDAAMRDSFLTGGDFHAETAAKVFRVSREQVTPEMRRRAKAVNFGIVYGISAFSLSQDIGVTVAEAKDYMERYFATYEGVKSYMDGIVEKAREQEYVETLLHRRRALPELKSSNFNVRSGAERITLNTPIQGSAADLIKIAMIRVENALQEHFPEAKLLLQVHDELIVECPEAIASDVAELISREMEQVSALTVPLTADSHWGKSWYEAK